MNTATANYFCGPLQPDVAEAKAITENLPTKTVEPKESNVAKLLAAIKFIGAGSVAAAMALFLLEGIEVTNDIQRFFTILGFGGLLTALGLAVNKWLVDRVASRLFIGLSLVAVPVIATVLGGLVFSLTDAAQALSLPTYATWQLASTASLYVALPLGLVVVSAIAALGFMIMARSEARWMTPALIASNALLLIPTRESAPVAFIAALAIVALVVLIRKKQVNPISFLTVEGRWALAVLLLAPIILVARTVLLYQVDVLMAVCLSGALYFASRYWFHHSQHETKSEIFALLCTVTTGTMAAMSIVAYAEAEWGFLFNYSHPLSGGLGVLWAALVLTASFDTARKNPHWFVSRLTHSLASAVASVGLIISVLFFEPSFIVTAAGNALLVGFMLVDYARAWYVEAGILLVAVATVLIRYSDEMLGALMSTGWWGLAAAGTSAIVGGAVLERAINQRSVAA